MKDERKDTELVEAQQQGIQMETQESPKGFDDDDAEDVIIPRIKVIQDLSPERKEKIATEGDLVNSLTKEILNGKNFVPVFKYSNNIMWKDRSQGGGMECISRDGKIGTCADGSCKSCIDCGLNKFDNKAVGKDAIPVCTAYFNFFGFIEGQHIPIILSFSKTYYNEGKKMYSMAKFSMKDMWKQKYAISTKKASKNDNEWYTLQSLAAGTSSPEDVAYAEMLFESFRHVNISADLEDNSPAENPNTITVDEDMANEMN